MVAGLIHKSLVGPASQALRDLTLECPITIAPFSQPILESCQVFWFAIFKSLYNSGVILLYHIHFFLTSGGLVCEK